MTQMTKREKNLNQMTQKEAMYLLKTVWPKAPDVEIIKAAIICQQYNLNPLMKQIFILKFKNKEGGYDYAIVRGIKSDRIIAQRAAGRYSYADGPRVMTEAEQAEIFGEADSSKLWAITKIKDRDGNIYPGYGFWPKSINVYGADKGNTPLNMAFIRSERNALDKMAPGALPDIDVIDDAYIEVTDVTAAIEEGKAEFQESAQAEADELWPPQDTGEPITEADLLAWVCGSKGFLTTATARMWLIGECGYTADTIKLNPGRIQKELEGRI